jgi:hypothetical protein
MGLGAPIPPGMPIGRPGAPAGLLVFSMRIQTHQIVEVNLIDSLILFLGEAQFVSHLVAQEECIISFYLVANSISRDGHNHHHCQKHNLLLNQPISFNDESASYFLNVTCRSL